LEAIQKKGQKHKMLILWSKDLENLKQERKALETHELDQETQTPSVKAIKYNNCLCLEINNHWHALHSTFNSTQNQQVDDNILDEFPDKHSTSWPPFLRKEFIRSIDKCSNLFALGPDKLS